MNALKRCKDKVVLLVAKTDQHYPSSPTMGAMPPLGPQSFMPQQQPRLGPRSVSEEELTTARQVQGNIIFLILNFRFNWKLEKNDSKFEFVYFYSMSILKVKTNIIHVPKIMS